MILSILIPTIYKRAGELSLLLRELYRQVEVLQANDKVEILVMPDHGSDAGGKTTGEKRNELMSIATGKYCIGHDDDDWPPSYYIEELLKAAESDADCFAMSGIITTNGKDEKSWFISKDLDYKALYDENGREVYHRYSNHITCIKTDIARQIKFPAKTIGEDYEWATALKNSGLLKTEFNIERFPMYHYKFLTHK